VKTYSIDEFSLVEQKKIRKRYVEAIVKNLTSRLSDTVSNLCILQVILKEKSDNPDFIKVATAFHIESIDLMTEWRILRMAYT